MSAENAGKAPPYPEDFRKNRNISVKKVRLLFKPCKKYLPQMPIRQNLMIPSIDFLAIIV